MKKFCLLLVGVIAFVLISCEEKIPPKPTAFDDLYYVYAKKKGKVLTGVQTHVGGIIIPTEYERITTGFEDTKFIVYQNGEAKVFNHNGKMMLDGMSIKPESIKFLGDKNYMALGNAYRFENTAGQKYWWFMSRYLFTGYDDLIPCRNGFVFKKNNKYGFAEFRASYDELKASNRYTIDQELKVTVSEKYDALYEITNDLSYSHFFLAKTENKWIVLDANGKPAKRYPSRINKNLINLPIKDKIERHPLTFEIPGGVARSGQEKAGLITFKISDFTWNSYFR